MIPVILSGGSGTRLWPTSRTKLPKQFCELFAQSLHGSTLQRLIPMGSPWIITSSELRDLTLRDAKKNGIPTGQVLLEPMARNTAPAIGLICQILEKMGRSSEVVGIFPADHLIEAEDLFKKALHLAEDEAQKGRIVTLGIQPTQPATGYGYIQVAGMAQAHFETLESFSVQKFHEKPSRDLAESFLKAGTFFWNAGIFVFKVEAMINAFKRHQPQMWQALSELKADLSHLKEIYAKVESISIDYAIMEKLSSSELACVPCDIGWNDVGSWDAIQEILGSDSKNKIEVGAKGNFIHSALDKKYAFIDVEDLIVVDTEDALLVCKRGSTQKVKDVVEGIKSQWPTLAREHTFELRPWGQYQILKNTPDFKSKVIEVLPQEQLSYQSHSRREEHWLVIKGVGEVVLNDKVIPVKAGTYINIPLGAKHRIRNTGHETIEFVEVQLGTYFGEDDIVRYQDDYQRI